MSNIPIYYLLLVVVLLYSISSSSPFLLCVEGIYSDLELLHESFRYVIYYYVEFNFCTMFDDFFNIANHCRSDYQSQLYHICFYSFQNVFLFITHYLLIFVYYCFYFISPLVYSLMNFLYSIISCVLFCMIPKGFSQKLHLAMFE